MSMMDKVAASGAFKPPAKADKADATTRAAREIIDRQTAERDAKTARLRALRLAKEAEDDAAKAAEPPKKAPAAKKAAADKPAAKPRKAAARG